MPKDAGRDQRTAVDIERLLEWAYRAERIHRHDDAGHLLPMERLADGGEPAGWSADGVEALRRIGEVGCKIDGHGGYHEPPPDAYAIHDAVKALPRKAAGLLIAHGRRADRPYWGQDIAFKLEPVWKEGGPRYNAQGLPARGAFVIHYDTRRKRAVSCPIKLATPPYFVDQLRDDYRQWWDAMDAVRATLIARASLQRFTPLPAMAPREPWKQAHRRDHFEYLKNMSR